MDAEWELWFLLGQGCLWHPGDQELQGQQDHLGLGRDAVKVGWKAGFEMAEG